MIALANPGVERVASPEEPERIKEKQRALDQEQVLERLIELSDEDRTLETDGYRDLLEKLKIEGLSLTRLRSVIWHLQRGTAKIQFFTRTKRDGTTIHKGGLTIVVLQGEFV